MIVRISGRLAEVQEGSALLERDGMGYEVLVPAYAAAELAASRGHEVTFHTLEFLEGNAAGGNLIPRLVGFLHPEDRTFFRRFMTVKGVGLRKGLRALAVPVGRIAADIEAGDAKGLARLPGIGPRLAEQIVAELRGKVSAHALAGHTPPAAALAEFDEEQRAALEILVAWGDGRGDAERWLARAVQLHDGLISAEEWVRAAYRIKAGAIA